MGILWAMWHVLMVVIVVLNLDPGFGIKIGLHWNGSFAETEREFCFFFSDDLLYRSISASFIWDISFLLQALNKNDTILLLLHNLTELHWEVTSEPVFSRVGFWPVNMKLQHAHSKLYAQS